MSIKMHPQVSIENRTNCKPRIRLVLSNFKFLPNYDADANFQEYRFLIIRGTLEVRAFSHAN